MPKKNTITKLPKTRAGAEKSFASSLEMIAKITSEISSLMERLENNEPQAQASKKVAIELSKKLTAQIEHCYQLQECRNELNHAENLKAGANIGQALASMGLDLTGLAELAKTAKSPEEILDSIHSQLPTQPDTSQKSEEAASSET